MRTRIKHLLYPFELKSLNNLSSPRVQSDQPRLKPPTHRTRPGERKAGPESIKKHGFSIFYPFPNFFPSDPAVNSPEGAQREGAKSLS